MPDSLSSLKKEELEKQLALLTEEYKAANAQLGETLNASEKPALKRRIKRLESEIQRVEDELGRIRLHPAEPAALEDEQRLVALPTGHLPVPAPLPPGSRMPFPRNPHFVGRE